MEKTTREPWERQINETEKQWNAFRIYRDLGQQRSFQKLADELGTSKTYVYKISCAKDWKDRILAYERHLDEKVRTTLEKQRVGMYERHVEIAKKLQNKALSKLAIIEISDMTVGDILRFLDLAVKIERETYILLDADKGKGDLSKDSDLTKLVESLESLRKKYGNSKSTKEDTSDE